MIESNQSEQTGIKVIFKDFIELWDIFFNSFRIKVRKLILLLGYLVLKKIFCNIIYIYVYISFFLF